MIHLWCSFMVTLCTCSMWGPSHRCHPSPGDLLMTLFRAQLCVFEPLFYTELNCSSLRFQSDFLKSVGEWKKSVWKAIVMLESHEPSHHISVSQWDHFSADIQELLILLDHVLHCIHLCAGIWYKLPLTLHLMVKCKNLCHCVFMWIHPHFPPAFMFSSGYINPSYVCNYGPEGENVF